MKNKKLLIILLILASVIVFLMLLKNNILKIIYPKEYSEFVSAYAKEYNVDEKLVYAVIKAESNFNIKAVSNKKALGLMQIMEETAKDVVRKYAIEINLDEEKTDTKEEIMDIQNNINIGTKYLAILIEKYSSVEVAIAAYNAGIGTVDGWIDKGIIKDDGSDIENVPFKETNNYVRKTLRNYKVYKQLY